MTELRPGTARTPVAATLAALVTLDEAELRDRILPPLLEKLGMVSVRHEHGPLERGKDLLAARTGPLGTQEWVAFVVKRGHLNARAGSTQAVRTVLQQVEQALEHEIVQKADSSTAMVRECWVVTNGRIPQYALDEACPALQRRGLDRCVRWIDGVMLAELLSDRFEPKMLRVMVAPRGRRRSR